MEKYAVIVAGGKGTRMGAQTPKQFLLLNGKPVLLYTIEAFLAAYNDLQVIVVLPHDFMKDGAAIIASSSDPSRVQLVGGGATRFHSVQNGLQKTNDPSIIFVHDGVRCLVSKKLIQNCFQQALNKGSAIPAIAVTDSIRIFTDTGTNPIDRNILRAVQTPQTFRSEIILPAFNQPYQEAFTDEATVVEAAGHTIHLIEGEKENIKITLPSDLELARQFMNMHTTNAR